MLRYIVPHLTPPQEAENVEDVVFYLAQQYRASPDPLRQPLKTLRAYLSSAYAQHRSAEFFQYLGFLSTFDEQEYREYVELTNEHVLLMRASEYLRSTYGFWLALWPALLWCVLALQYGLGFSLDFAGAGRNTPSAPNRHSNPAADIRNHRRAPPAAAVVPIKVSGKKS